MKKWGLGCLSVLNTLTVVLALSACVGPPRVAVVAPLAGVERGSGSGLARQIEEGSAVAGYSFEDETVRILASAGMTDFRVQIENRTPDQLQLAWGGASWVHTNGEAAAVIPGETRGGELNAVPRPTAIPPNSHVSFLALPRNRVELGAQGWMIDPMFIPEWGCEQLASDELRLILPIARGEEVVDYTLRFRVDSLSMRRVPEGQSASSLGRETITCRAPRYRLLR